MTIPNDLAYIPQNFIFLIEGSKEEHSFYIAWKSDFFSKKIGSILTSMMFIFRDVITVVVEVILNVISFNSLRKFLKKKLVILKIQNNIVYPMNTVQTDINNHIVENQSNEAYHAMTVAEKVTRSEKKATIMVIFMSFVSIYMHLTVLVCQTYEYINYGPTSILIGYLVLAAASLNNSFYTFFVLFYFNENFKRYFVKIIKSLF